ncbi:MAG: FAD-dependent oxidoreductase [Erysipelotrichaceae bacterium]|nr:FAD-dependent oxidoreductase [Erysipelotrichaceae bacterium]
MKVCIVGGVAGGAGVAARLRRHDENYSIIMFEKGEHISYANCGLPYYIGDVITDEEELYLQTPTGFYERFNVDVRVLNEIVSVDPQNKQLLVRNVVNGQQYHESYDVLVLSPGAKPMIFPLPGIDLPHIFTLRNVRDTLTIKKFIKNNRVKKAVVIGGGYIGLEMAENLHKLNIQTTIVEAASHVVNTLDEDMAAILHNQIREQGVKLFLNSKAVAFNQHQVILHTGEQLPADMVLLSIGVSPETGFLADSGIALGSRKEILTDAQGKTNVKDVYALGDAAGVNHVVSNTSTIIPLASPANKQARVVADAIAGKITTYKGSQGTAIAQVFDKVVAVTGENERSLQMQNRPYLTSLSINYHHASYYPGAERLIIKCYFTPIDGVLLGAQIIGSQGVDKRIDTLAVAVRYGMKVTDLQDFELAYAPPFGSAKDPVNMAGYVAENVLIGKTRQVSPLEIMHSDAIKLDVRDDDEVEEGTIVNSVHIPLPQLRNRINELNKDQTYIIYCAVGLRGYLAEQILRHNGYDVYNAAGGYYFYHEYLSSTTNK